MKNFLIPANSKKSMLILGFFNWIDLIIFGTGCTISLFIIMLFNSDNNLLRLILMLLPAIISGFLVMPVPNYHNMLTLIKNVYLFFTTNRRYHWKGWNYRNEE